MDLIQLPQALEETPLELLDTEMNDDDNNNHHHHHQHSSSSATAAASHHHHHHHHHGILLDDDDDNDQEIPLPKMKKLKLKDDDDSSFAFQNPTKQCLARIHNDLTKLYHDPIEGIFVVPDDSRANQCHAIVLGPAETPYEFGFFYFIMDFPNQYPHVPPRVTLQTTGGGTVRFNPNLYRCGKVCLSILGTWNGPSWTPALTIGSVLLSIQSLMNAAPYHNEPGFETVNRRGREPRNYNHVIRHETIRVAVIGMVSLAKEEGKLPDKLSELIIDTFQATNECCQYLCEEYKTLDGQPFQDPYKKNKGSFYFLRLRRRLVELEQTLFSSSNNNNNNTSGDPNNNNNTA